jgi:RNA polymerase sigma-70 factor (ECF subfamily)
MTEKDRFDFNLILEKLSGQEYLASIAFKELYDRFAPNIYFSAKKFLKSEALAEDVVQEVFTAIWEKRTQISFIQNFESYLYGMTSKKAYDVIRRRVNAEAIKRKHLDLMAVSEDPSKEKYAQQLDALIEKLPYPRKDIFQHAKIDGIQGKAIAERCTAFSERLNFSAMAFP